MAEVYYTFALYSYVKERKNKISELEKKLLETKPKWTAVVPAYNEEENIQESLESILNQTYPPVEVIVLDDKSADNTLRKVFKLMKKYNAELREKGIIYDKNQPFGTDQIRVIFRFYIPKLDIILTYVRNTKNVGKTMNLNWAAFNLVKTEYFANIDGDTILEKDYAEKVLPLLLEKGVGATFGIALPKKKNTLFGKFIYYIKYFMYAKRGQILRRFQDLLKFQYNFFGAAVFFNTNIYRKIPRPIITNSRDTLQAWLFQLNDIKVKYNPKSFAYTDTPQSLKEFIKERRKWGSGIYQATYLLFKQFIRRKRYKELIVPLLSYIVPLKYSIAAFAIPILGLITNNFEIILKFWEFELGLFLTATGLNKLFYKNYNFKDMVIGVFYLWSIGKYFISAVTIYNWLKNTYEYLTKKWITKWRNHYS